MVYWLFASHKSWNRKPPRITNPGASWGTSSFLRRAAT